MERIGSRHSSCLWFQMLSVEALSLLPNGQSDRGDLARQSQARHLRSHSLGYSLIVKLLKRTILSSGHGGRTFEQILQIMIVIAIQPTNRDRLLVAPQRSIYTTVLGTAVVLDSEPDVGPELSLGTEPVRGLEERDN
jgi:hypothetical protein